LLRTTTRIVGLTLSGFFGIGFTAMSLMTLLPATASKPNLLGYYGVCSFAPMSTALLIVFAAVSMFIALKIRNK
jgi:hypothetical protein